VGRCACCLNTALLLEVKETKLFFPIYMNYGQLGRTVNNGIAGPGFINLYLVNTDFNFGLSP